MNYLFLIILCLPSAILFFKHIERTEIIVQFLIALGLLFLGWKIFKAGGCLKLTGILMILLGIAAYWFLIIEPLFTGQLSTWRIW